MKKRNLITAAAVLAATALSLAACGQKTDNTAPSDTVATEAKETGAAGSAAEEIKKEAAAGQEKAAAKADPLSEKSFDELKEEAKGTTVTFYGWGGDEKLNAWLDNTFAPVMKEKYDIEMERVPMDIDQVLSQLSGEIEAGEQDGSIDMIWINGENFKSAKENNMLYGPFTEKLPNFKEYVDAENEDNTLDFGYPIEGYEAPYGKAQFVLVADTAVTPELPKSAEELKAFVEAHPGQVTYPALPDFTGSVFVRNIIDEICGYEQFLDMEPDKETVRAAIEPAMEYLRSLNPFLWNQGKTFPDSSTTLDNMFKDGEVVLNMSYDAYATALNIADGSYPETAQAFQFDKGTIGNTNFMAIAANAGNKAGALIAINEMISPEMQASRYENLLVIPVLDNSKLSAEQQEAFDKVDLGEGVIPQEELLAKRLPEMPAGLVPVIEEIWAEEVVGK